MSWRRSLREKTPVTEPRVITTVGDYQGEAKIAVAATQLGTDYTRTQASKVVSEWVEFLAAGPSPIEDLAFVSRTPKRLFAALAGQTQLRHLSIKWGDYEDLSPLRNLSALDSLRLGGASSVRSVAPLAYLTRLTSLEIEGLRYARDLTPLQGLVGLTHLELGGNWMSPRIAHIDSIAWIVSLGNLVDVLLHTLIVDDLDYTPLLALPHLRTVRMMEARGMKPSIAEFQARYPASEW